jgi:hypothetical protein
MITGEEKAQRLEKIQGCLQGASDLLALARECTEENPVRALKRVYHAMFYLEEAGDRVEGLELTFVAGLDHKPRVGQYLPAFEAPDGTIYAGSRVVGVTDERESND